MRTARADVARDLRELVGGHEHAVIALVFEVQVVARHLRDRARLEAREARDAVVLVHDDVARAQLGEGAQRPAPAPGARAPVGALGTPPAQQPVLGIHRELQCGATKPSRSDAATKRSEGSSGWLPVGPPSSSSPSHRAFTRARLYAARSPSPRLGNATTVR